MNEHVLAVEVDEYDIPHSYIIRKAYIAEDGILEDGIFTETMDIETFDRLKAGAIDPSLN